MSQITYVSERLIYVTDICDKLLEFYVLEIHVEKFICVRLILLTDVCLKLLEIKVLEICVKLYMCQIACVRLIYVTDIFVKLLEIKGPDIYICVSNYICVRLIRLICVSNY